MQALQVKHSYYKYPRLVLLCTIIYCALISLMTINSRSIASSNYLFCLVGTLVLSCTIPLGTLLNCIFMTIPFTSVLKLPIESFSFITLLQVILIVRSFFSKTEMSFFRVLCILLVGGMTQIIPMLIFDQQFNNLLLLLLNLLTFYSVYTLTREGRVQINHTYISFSIGVVIAGEISIIYNIYVTDYFDYRFTGLWTDSNFWGMFCLIGIVPCIITGIKQPLRFIFWGPIIVSLAYQGFLTLSRTFVVVSALMICVTLWSHIKRKPGVGVIVFTVFILTLLVYYAFPYALEVFSERELDSNDMTNGRFENTSLILDYISKNIIAVLFGTGYNNILNVMDEYSFGIGATHNSYADLFVDFGLITNYILLIVLLARFNSFKRILHGLPSLPGIMFSVILFYMVTLSMLKYAILFIFAGIFVGSVYPKKT